VATVADRLRSVEHLPRPPGSPRLRAAGASFVTLERCGRLRGCIGSIDARRPLYLDVVRNALRAMVDPRLPRVTAADWPELEVKVAVLTAPSPAPVTGRAALVAALRPGVDGLLLTAGARRSTFLPAVWDKLPDPDRFLDALLAKGGWPAWSEDICAFMYQSHDFADRSAREPLGPGPTT
jgi:AmmeMemoRadiSam system protein A